MKLKAVAFDLGGTLVQYYEREEFPTLLAQAIENVRALVKDRASASLSQAQDAAMTENREQADGRVCPLQERLARIFGLTQSLPPELQEAVGRAFLKPIFECGRKYDDTDAALADLRMRGYRLAIASNTPWGSPSAPWREELARLGLAKAVDVSLFCVDVGWRKPAPMLFRAASQALRVRLDECAFVGDHPRWDYEGSEAAGMIPVLIQREPTEALHSGNVIRALGDLAGLLDRM
jgi:FMN phosphatase YigB (HAD superfamily)